LGYMYKLIKLAVNRYIITKITTVLYKSKPGTALSKNFPYARSTSLQGTKKNNIHYYKIICVSSSIK